MKQNVKGDYQLYFEPVFKICMIEVERNEKKDNYLICYI